MRLYPAKKNNGNIIITIAMSTMRITHLKSPVNPLFVQPLIKANIKENTNARVTARWFPITKGQ